jgi:hypothetical protein
MKGTKMRLPILLTGVIAAAAVFPSLGQEGDAWKPFEFLIGRWAGSGAGVSGEAEFSLDLGRSVLIRRNRTVLAPRSGAPSDAPVGAVHEDLLVIYREADGKFRADYFDNEGHVIHYTSVTADSGRRIVLQSEPAGGMPAFRLIHRLDADSLLFSDFQVAPPGGEFKTHVRGTVKRIR